MQLLECIALKPGLLEKKKVRFDKRVTLIYGKNDSGKTLIAKALMDTLWGEFSGSLSLNGNTWDDLCFEVLFQNASGRYRFTRNKKDSFLINYADTKEGGFNKERVILQRNADEIEGRNNGRTWFTKLYEATKDKETAGLFNKVDIQTFMNVSYLSEPFDLARNGQLDYKAIQRFLLDDGSNFYTLYKNISGAVPYDKMPGNSISNEILKKENDVKNIDRKIQIFGIQSSKTDRLHKEKTRLEQELKSLNDELSDVREHKTKLINIQNNLKRLADLDASVENQNKEMEIEQGKKDSILKMEQDIKDQYPQFYSFEESNTFRNLKKIQETYREVRDVHEEIENFYLSRAEKKNKFKNIILTINISSILSLAALFGISSYAFPIQFLNEYKIQFIIGLLILSISSSLLFLLYYALSLKRNGLKEIIKKKSNIERKMEEILQKNNITLNEYKLEAIYEYLVKYFEEYGEYSISQSELSSMKEALKWKDNIRRTEDDIEQLKREKTALKQEIDNDVKLLSIKDESITGSDIEKIDSLIQDKNQRIKNLKESIAQTGNLMLQIDEEITHGGVHANETITLNIEKNRTEDTIKKLNSYKISIEYIANLLKEAVIRREDKQISGLVKTAGENFHFLTDYQYADSINDDAIKRIIKNEIYNEELNMSILHILFLSIKLAVTNSFDGLKINLPLIIDEPFQQMDEQRINRFKKILDDISNKRQVIIFTHNKKYKDWGAFTEL